MGHGQVELLMRRAGLQGISGRRKWKKTRPDNIVSDRVERDFNKSVRVDKNPEQRPADRQQILGRGRFGAVEQAQRQRAGDRVDDDLRRHDRAETTGRLALGDQCNRLGAKGFHESLPVSVAQLAALEAEPDPRHGARHGGSGERGVHGSPVGTTSRGPSASESASSTRWPSVSQRALATRSYVTGSLTSPAVVIPYWIWARRTLAAEGVPAARGSAWGVLALVPVLPAVLVLAYVITGRRGRGTAR